LLNETIMTTNSAPTSRSPSEHGAIRCERAGNVAWITIDNVARRNAISQSMWRALTDIMHATETDPEVRCRVISGAGDRSFAAGADIAQMENRLSDQSDEYGAAMAAACGAIDQSTKPLIAMIRGFCFGAGVAIAAKADLRIAADDSQFAIPAARMGLAYSTSFTRDLLRVMHPSAAKLLLFTAQRLNANEALRIGLVDEVTSHDGLKQRVTTLATHIVQNAPLSVRASKVTIDLLTGKHNNADLVDQLAEQCRTSADHAEGMRAFLEKRTPVFLGR
jgi:enoyl-CoA hydratase/carnithine racemase